MRSEDKGADLDNGCVDSNAGVMTSNRIRVKYPVIENKTFVSKNAADAVDNLGARSPEWQEIFMSIILQKMNLYSTW